MRYLFNLWFEVYVFVEAFIWGLRVEPVLAYGSILFGPPKFVIWAFTIHLPTVNFIIELICNF